MADRGAGEKDKQDCWKLMTISEKVLLFLLIITIIITLTLFIFIVSLFLYGNDMCDSTSCIQTSAKLLESMDLNTDPCQNFQQFVCGKQILGVQDPDNVIKKINLISAPSQESDSKSISTVKRFYQACVAPMDDENLDALQSLLDEIGGWPLLQGQNWDDRNFNWIVFLTKLRDLGIKSDWFLGFDVFMDEVGRNHLWIGPPPDLKPQPLRTVYYENIVQIAAKMGSSVEIALKEMQNVTNLENDLVTISQRAWDSSKADSAGNNIKIEIGNLNAFWPSVDLVEIFNTLSREYSSFTNETVVVLGVESYIYELNKLLMRTPRRTQANFITWKIIEGYLPYLSDDIRNLYQAYSTIDGRSQHCFQETTKRFYGAIETEFLSKYTKEDMTQALKVMVNLIKDCVIDTEFASSHSEIAIMGLEGENAGVSDLDLESSNIIRMINEVHLKVEDQFYSCLNSNSASCGHQTYHHKSKSQPYFDIAQNIFYFPSDMIEGRWYDSRQPAYLNFGRLGRIVGDVILEAVRNVNESSMEVQESTSFDVPFVAYLRWVERHGLEKRLPGLNYTTKQVFWIYAGFVYCSLENNPMMFFNVTKSKYFENEFECM